MCANLRAFVIACVCESFCVSAFLHIDLLVSSRMYLHIPASLPIWLSTRYDSVPPL